MTLPGLEAVAGCRRILVRTDFNVPLRDGEVVDDFRIRGAVPTLEALRATGADVTVCSHLGDPKGYDEALVIEPVRRRLAELCPGVEVLENLRFDPGEKADDEHFVSQLIEGHDGYVNEAFGVSHRAHGSVVGPPRHLPSAAGFLLGREVDVLAGLLDAPASPFVAVVGGAKVADKLGVLEALATRVDTLVIGGAMAFTFLAALGHEVGSSIVDASKIEACRKLLASRTKVLLPIDVVALEPGGVIGHPSPPHGDVKITGVDLSHGWRGLDIGPESGELFAEAISQAGTVLWNGPMGVFEDDRFAGGTEAVARAVAAASGYTVVGGGDSVRALDALELGDEIDFVSTGGGASLAFVEKGDLPGLAALRASASGLRR